MLHFHYIPTADGSSVGASTVFLTEKLYDRGEALHHDKSNQVSTEGCRAMGFSVWSCAECMQSCMLLLQGYLTQRERFSLNTLSFGKDTVVRGLSCVEAVQLRSMVNSLEWWCQQASSCLENDKCFDFSWHASAVTGCDRVQAQTSKLAW